MIASISGTVREIGEESIVILVGGVGLRVHVPSDVLSQAKRGKPIELSTHLHVRENDLTLYGFLTQDELSLFQLLMTVSGVGPKVGLAVLSTLSPAMLRQAVTQDQPSVLARVPGIGPKTAKAIIFHLKDRVAGIEGAEAPLLTDEDAEVISALTALGFSVVEAQSAVQNLPEDDALSVEERVRQALTYFA